MVKKSRRRRHKANKTPMAAHNVEVSTVSQPHDLAIRLLYLQQRLDALERLFGEEIVGLKHDLAEINIEFVRQAQAQGRLDSHVGDQTPADDLDDEDDAP